jgi:PadR family transcriptional regulator PadR
MYTYPPLFPALPNQTFYVLLALSRGEAYAYAIGAIAINDSLGTIKMGDGTLYPLLKRMSEDRLIEEAGLQPAGKSGKDRMHYRLTQEGRFCLEEEAKRFRHAVKIAEAAGLLNNPVPTEIRRLLNNL